MEKILFDHVNHLGEMQNNYFQIIDISDSVDEDSGEKKFKIYYSNESNSFDNFCIDIEKRNLGTDDNGIHLGWEYVVFDEWEGFNQASISYYCKILS